MTSETCHIGVLGAARIAMKNCRAVSHPSTSCSIVAIASRSEQKGQDFVNEIFTKDGKSAPLVIGGENAYLDLLSTNGKESAPKIDAVYIPLPTKLHETYVARALSSGHHVLLEKPVAESSESYRKMLKTASENGKLLMDGTMFVHHPRTKEFVNSIPNPNRVHFNFTFDGGEDFLKNDIRIKKDGDFMGCIGDVGWYCVRMALLIFSGLNAKALKGLVTGAQVVRHQLNEEGVPIDTDCMVYFTDVSVGDQYNFEQLINMFFYNGNQIILTIFSKTICYFNSFQNRVLSFHCSFLHPLNQTVQISGSGQEYSAILTDPILPHKGDTISFKLVKQDLIQYDAICTNETKLVECDNNLVQEVRMWGNFAKWTRKIEESVDAAKDVENEVWWGGDSEEVKEANAIASYSLHTQIVLDALMESIRLSGAKVQVK